MSDPADTVQHYQVTVRVANCDEDWGVGDGVIGACVVDVTIPAEYAGHRLKSNFTKMKIADIVREKTEEFIFAGPKPLIEVVVEHSK